MKKQIITLAAIALIAMGCNSTKKNNADTMENSETEMAIDNSIFDKNWNLQTLEGQEVSLSENQEQEIHFMLKTDGNQVTGFAGCNTLNGTYTLEKGNRIRFSNMLTTLMACPDVDFKESEFLQVFELADNYTINGNTLSLNVGRRAPLAVFEAVESVKD